VRSPEIDRCGSADAIAARWEDNFHELQRHANLFSEAIDELRRLTTQFIAGRSLLFTQRVSDGRIVDGHADLLTDDIFCPPGELAILDCLEFDDQLRYVDVIDDAAFLAMDLEYLGREDLGRFFLGEYGRRADDNAPQSLTDFYVAYRALVRGKVDCVRVEQGHEDAVADARRHIEIALKHLKSAVVQLIVVGGGPGTGKTTLSLALADKLGAQVISTDDVRRELQRNGVITGSVGVLDAGLYSSENVAVVYDEVLKRALRLLSLGWSVVLDGTWRDTGQRARARRLADQTSSPIVELTCSVPLAGASARIRSRRDTTSDATPEIAAPITDGGRDDGDGARLIDTARPLDQSVEEALQICRIATCVGLGGETKWPVA
jgi:predicted kinase